MADVGTTPVDGRWRRMITMESVVPADRLRFMAAAVLYFAIFVWAYRQYGHVHFGYFGLGWDEGLPADLWLLIAALAALPACWMPLQMERPANFLLLILYFVVYVPSLMLAFHGDRPGLPRSTSVELSVWLFAGLSLIQLVQRSLPAVALPRPALPGWGFWLTFAAFGIFCGAYIAKTLGGHATLVSLAEIYLLRTEAADAIADTGSRFGGYAFSWLNSFVLPLLYAQGWYRRRWSLCVLAIAAYLFLFSVWGGKASLFAPLALLGLTLLLRFPLRHFPVLLALVFGGLLLSPVLIDAHSTLGALVQSWLVSLIHQRTFGSSALLITQYHHFFELHPLTLGSHVTGINLFVDYPYAGDIPRTIGSYFYGSPMTANVNFWGQDGIAAFGMPGIVAASTLCAAVFWLLDSAGRRLDPRFMVLCLAYTATNFADTSIFTTLVTGGLLLLIGSLWLIPRDLPPARGSS